MHTMLSAGGVCLGGICPGAGGVCPRGCLPKGGVYPSMWTEWLTDRCKNITFQQLRLQSVIKNHKHVHVWLSTICNSNFCIQFRIPLKRTKKISHCAVEFEADEENSFIRKFAMDRSELGMKRNLKPEVYLISLPVSPSSLLVLPRLPLLTSRVKQTWCLQSQCLHGDKLDTTHVFLLVTGQRNLYKF